MTATAPSDTNCLTCTLTQARDEGRAPAWDSIRRFDHWDLVHAYDSALEGWLVLVLRRHLTALADLTDGEAVELGRLTRIVSSSLRQVTGCAKTYVVQFAEHPKHPHVHVHLVARPADLADELQGPSIFGFLGAAEADRVSEARRNALAFALRDVLPERLD